MSPPPNDPRQRTLGHMRTLLAASAALGFAATTTRVASGADAGDVDASVDAADDADAGDAEAGEDADAIAPQQCPPGQQNRGGVCTTPMYGYDPVAPSTSSSGGSSGSSCDCRVPGKK